MELVKVSDFPSERGRLLDQRIRTALVQVVKQNQHSLAAIPKDKRVALFTEEGFRGVGRRELPDAREYILDLLGKVEGLAPRVGLPFDAVYGLNSFCDFPGIKYPGLGNELLLGYTTMAATNRATANNRAYLGQNDKWLHPYQKGLTLLPMEVPPGPEALIFTIIGWWAAPG